MRNVVWSAVAAASLAVFGCGGTESEQLAAETPRVGAVEQALYNFQVGVQVADDGSNVPGAEQFTGVTVNPGAGQLWGSESAWAEDGDSDTSWDDDPDTARIAIRNGSGLLGSDFRVGIQVMDRDGNTVSPIQWSPWATELASWSVGWSPFALDNDKFDPNKVRVHIQTRSWSGYKVLRDFRLHLKTTDNVCSWFSCSWQEGSPVATPWAATGAGWSDWAHGAGGWDPDGFAIGLEVSLE